MTHTIVSANKSWKLSCWRLLALCSVGIASSVCAEPEVSTPLPAKQANANPSKAMLNFLSDFRELDDAHFDLFEAFAQQDANAHPVPTSVEQAAAQESDKKDTAHD